MNAKVRQSLVGGNLYCHALVNKNVLDSQALFTMFCSVWGRSAMKRQNLCKTVRNASSFLESSFILPFLD